MKFIPSSIPEGAEEPGQAFPSILVPRMQALLRPTPLQDFQDITATETAHSPVGWLDLAQEASFAGDTARALDAVEQGLKVAQHHPEARLSLLRAGAAIRINVPDLTKMQRSQDPADEEAALEFIAQRTRLLRELGQPRQAELEDQLGIRLCSPPDSFDVTVLEGVAESERAAGSADTVLADVLATLAIYRLNAGAEGLADSGEAAQAMADEDSVPETLAHEALHVVQRQQQAGLIVPVNARTGVQRILAHAAFVNQKHHVARELAHEILAGGCSRVYRADMWTVLARAIYSSDEDVAEATRYALRALEMYSRLEIRYGAVATATLIAAIASQHGAEDIALVAWQVAVAQAEQGEIPEVPALRLALGHQMLTASDPEGAEKVLRQVQMEHSSARNRELTAQAQIYLAQALQEQQRTDEAVALWDEAVDLMVETGNHKDAAKLCIGTASLLAHTYRDDIRAERYFARAVKLARQLSGEMRFLAHTLHMHGRVLLRMHRPEGLTLLDEATGYIQQLDVPWFEADIAISKARGLQNLGQPNKAVALALTAADTFAEVQDTRAQHDAENLAGHILLDSEQWLEAIAIFSGLEDALNLNDTVRKELYLGLSLAYEKINDDDAAQRYHDRAQELRLDPVD